MVHKLYDKAQFQMLAERESLSVPRGVILSNPSDLALISELNLPLVIKPADKAPLVSNLENDRPVRVDTRAEAYQVTLRMMEKAGRLAIQEWIEGDDSDIYFSLFVCDSEGKVVAMFSGRKLVCDPPDVGITAICTAAPEIDEELSHLSRQFIERVGYKGIGGLEFKRDRRSGRLVITEPTVGRIDWQEEIATLCGVNIPLAAYCAETGVPFKESARQTSQHDVAFLRCAPPAGRGLRRQVRLCEMATSGSTILYQDCTITPLNCFRSGPTKFSGGCS